MQHRNLVRDATMSVNGQRNESSESAVPAFNAHDHHATLVVDRARLAGSLRQLARAPTMALMTGEVEVQFENEEGLDWGGLRREWVECMSSFLDPSSKRPWKRKLFSPAPDGGLLPTPLPDECSVSTGALHAQRTALFATGRLMAFAVCTGIPMHLPFSRCVYKVLLGEEIRPSDVRSSAPAV